MLEPLVVRVQEEVLEAIGDVVVRQKLQIVLIKLEFHWVLVMNLERKSQLSGLNSWAIALIANHTDALTMLSHKLIITDNKRLS